MKQGRWLPLTSCTGLLERPGSPALKHCNYRCSETERDRESKRTLQPLFVCVYERAIHASAEALKLLAAAGAT